MNFSSTREKEKIKGLEMKFIENNFILEIKEIQLFEITGKLIYKKAKLEPSSNHKISTSELSNGVYFVTIETKNGKKITQKIIVSPN